MSKSAKYLILFFIIIGLHKFGYVFEIFTGVNTTKIFGVSMLNIALLFLFLSFIKLSILQQSQSILIAKKKLFYIITFLIIYLVFLVFYGYFSYGNLINLIFVDLWIYAVFLMGIYIGLYDYLLEEIEKPLILIFWIFYIITIIADQFPQKRMIEFGFDYSYFGGYTPGASEGYQVSSLLEFWPFLYLTSIFRRRNDFWKFLAQTSIIVYLALEIHFNKRAPTGRAVLLFILSVYFSKKIGIKFNIKKLLFIASLVSAFLLYNSIESLTKKFETKDVSRINEAEILLKQLNSIDWIIGRGIGGYFIISEDYGTGIIKINNQGEYGKSILHTGFLFPLLKGGIILTIIYFLLTYKAFVLYRNPNYLRNKYNFFAIVYLISYITFQLTEGPFSTGVVFPAFFVGVSVARLFKPYYNVLASYKTGVD